MMPASHPTNPGGETLPSEPFPVLMPALNGRQVVVTVHWSQVAGAVGYRVYRSPAAGAESTSESGEGAASTCSPTWPAGTTHDPSHSR